MFFSLFYVKLWENNLGVPHGEACGVYGRYIMYNTDLQHCHVYWT